jgi:hypothetical protein
MHLRGSDDLLIANSELGVIGESAPVRANRICNSDAASPCNTKKAPCSFPCNAKNAPCSLGRAIPSKALKLLRNLGEIRSAFPAISESHPANRQIAREPGRRRFRF